MFLNGKKRVIFKLLSIVIVLSVLFGVGCRRKKYKETDFYQTENEEGLVETKGVSTIDVELSDDFFSIVNIKKDSFLFLKEKFKSLKKDSVFPKHFLSQKDTVYYITYLDGSIDSLVSNTATLDDGDDFIDYNFSNYFGKNKTLFFKVHYYEGSTNLLINLNSKKKNYLWGVPVFSKDSSKVFATSYDMEVGYDHNGIQLFNVQKDSLQLVFKKEIQSWGIEECFWVDNNELAVERKVPTNSTADNNEEIKYSLLKLNINSQLKQVLKANKSSDKNLNVNLFNYKGLQFYSAKKDILEKLGKPISIYEPNYDCGGLSSSWQGVKYYTIDYGFVKFTGNKKEDYVIESIVFNEDAVNIFYGEYQLSNKTTLEELAKIFGSQILKHFKDKPQNGGFIIHHKEYDDGIRIEIKEGKLTKLEYWTPC